MMKNETIFSGGVYNDPATDRVGVLYNACYGGFSFSKLALVEYSKRTGKTLKRYEHPGRHDQIMVDVVKELGDKASNDCSQIEVVYVHKDHVEYIDIHEYDGLESIEINWSQYVLDSIYTVAKGDEPDVDKISKILSMYVN